ncbi:MAG: hypothetical protein JWO32_617 [Bacteroidetes bacterium]|nr:hypothetical protein [Bacteroidota bacterium]
MKLLLFLFSANLCFSQAWFQLADLPGAQRDDGVGAVIGNEAFFGTGSNGSGLENSFYKLNLSSNTWSAIASMPAGSNRQYASAFAYSNYLFVSCGIGNAGAVFSDTYRYDAALNTWTTAASKPGTAVWGAASFTLGSKAYVFGGKYANSAGSDEVWEYDMIANTWIQKNNFPFGARWRASAAVLTNTAYVIFGLDNTGTGAFRKEIYKYIQVTDTWLKVADIPQPNRGRAYSSMQTINNKLIIFGGLDTLNNYYNDSWFFDEINGFVQGPALPSFGRKGGMACASGNKFYYSCGINITNTRLKETWLLDLSVGIEKLDNANAFYIYPNPNNGWLTIHSNEQPEHLCFELCDLTGNKIQTGKTNNNLIDISLHAKGIYFLKILQGQTVIGAKKIIKE